MSDLNIKLNLDTTAAEAGAAGVKDDLTKLRADAERPVHINVDASGLSNATGGASRLKEALGNVQAAALGEMSQKAAELGGHLGGVAGSLAQVAIKSAAAFGPWGIALTALLAGLALVKQAIDEENAATDRSNAISESLASSNNILGDSYGSVADAANRAKTAEEARIAVGQRTSAILAEQLALLSSGASLQTSQQLSSNFENIARASIDASTGVARYTAEQVKNIALTGNAQQQILLFGTSMEHSTNAIDNQTRALIVSSTAIVQRLTLENQSRQMAVVVAEALRAAEQRKSTADESSSETAERLAEAERQVQIASDYATASTNNLYVANQTLTGATADLTEHQNHLTDAEKNLANERQRQAELQNQKTTDTARIVHGHADVHVLAQQRMASAEGARNLVLQLNNDLIDRNVAALQRQEDALTRLMDRAVDNVTFDENHYQESLRRIQAQQNITEGASKAQDKARNDELENQRSYGGQMRQMLGEEINAKKELASGTMMAFNNMGKALGAHVTALAQGKETVGEALKGMLADTLTSLGQEAIVKGAMEMAHGFAALAGVYTAGLAPGHFAAGAAYMAVGAAASVAGAALSPAPAVSGGGGGGGGGGAAARAETPNRSTGSSDQAPKNITINMNAFQSNESAQALIVRSLREAGYAGRSQVGMSTSR